jgi:uncharacterized protein
MTPTIRISSSLRMILSGFSTHRRTSLSMLVFALFGLSACGDAPQEAAGPARVAEIKVGCGAPATRISDIQGSGATSPLQGNTVTIEAVLTSGYLPVVGGAFVQEEREDRDGDPKTSEGLVVITDESKNLKSGELVRITGTVSEYGDVPGQTVTALKDISEFLSCGPKPVPAPTGIEKAPLVSADWERFEAMRVTLDLPLTVIENDQLEVAGALTVSLSGRQYQPTELFPPGEDARKLFEDNQRNRLILDDASSADFPKRVSWLTQAIGHDSPYRIGTRLGEVEGHFDERFGSYRVHVSKPPVVEQAPRPKQPPEIEGELKIMSFNLANWFNGDAKSDFTGSRGAQDRASMQRQQGKLLAALAAPNADIIALMEVENDGDQVRPALRELVEALNAQTGRKYAWVKPPGSAAKANDGVFGGDQIRVAIVYRKSAVQAIGEAAGIMQAPFDRLNRPPLAQTFETLSKAGKPSGRRFTLVVNHWKSKGGCDVNDAANKDHNDGQACWNAIRVEAARSILGWLASDPTRSSDSDFLLLGDFNAYAQEDPIRLLREAGFMRFADGKKRAPSYSFSFRGALGRLDHALASKTLASQIADAAIWHINAEEYPGFAYQSPMAAHPDLGTQAQERARALYRRNSFRASDHDPILIGLTLDASEPAAPDATAASSKK